MIIGAGPIVIGQACEFDYSGTQACKALKEEGYRVILVNSNPATIMTDPGSRRRHLYRADHAGDRRQDHRARAARRAAPDHGRADRAQLRAVAAQDGHAGEIQRQDDRRHRRRHRQGGRPRAVPRGHDQASACRRRARIRSRRWRRRSKRSTTSACRRSSARRSRSAAPAAASPTTRPSSSTSSKAASTPPPPAKC